MSKSKMGAIVRYCGHEAVFVADIFDFNTVNVVVANGPLDKHLRRSESDVAKATHHLSDFPKAGYWSPVRGVFVVPGNQVKEL